jgi:hypothetical protein
LRNPIPVTILTFFSSFDTDTDTKKTSPKTKAEPKNAGMDDTDDSEWEYLAVSGSERAGKKGRRGVTRTRSSKKAKKGTESGSEANGAEACEFQGEFERLWKRIKQLEKVNHQTEKLVARLGSCPLAAVDKIVAEKLVARLGSCPLAAVDNIAAVKIIYQNRD